MREYSRYSVRISFKKNLVKDQGCDEGVREEVADHRDALDTPATENW